MSMVPLILAVMQSEPAVRAQLGNPVRFYYGAAPLNTPMPFAVWTVAGGSPLEQLSDTPPADGWRIRITVWAKGLSPANNAAMAIRDAIERRGSIESYNPTPDDEGTGDSGISFDARLLSLR